MRAARAAEIPPGRGKAIDVEGRTIALFHDAERGFLATDDACPHEGTSLASGVLHDGRVICPSHAWVFDAATGACHGMPGVRVACYATRPAGDAVEVELPDAAGGAQDAGQSGA